MVLTQCRGKVQYQQHQKFLHELFTAMKERKLCESGYLVLPISQNRNKMITGCDFEISVTEEDHRKSFFFGVDDLFGRRWEVVVRI